MAIRELLWLKKFEFLLPRFEQPVKVLLEEDNRGCINVSETGIVNDRTKHIGVQEQMAIKNIKSGNIQVEWTPSTEQVEDGLTKALNSAGHTKFISQLGIADSSNVGEC